MTCCLMLGVVSNVSVVAIAGLAMALAVTMVLGVVFKRKPMLVRLGILVAFVALVGTAADWWLVAMQPENSTALAVRQFAGGAAAAREVRTSEFGKNAVNGLAGLVIVLAALWCFGGELQAFARKWKATGITGLLAIGTLTGCMKPYDRPEYVEIDTSETGFLIPLEGDSTQQARFQSEDYLKQRKVATKRVQVLHRWSQEGRIGNDGRWIPVVRLVKVNRSPVTREWTTGQAAGTNAHEPGTGNGRAIWIESADSVGFSMGFNCTAFISEDDAAKFLYWYPSGSLANVMDQEVRGRIQQVAAEVAAKYPLDALRAKKQEIADAVKLDIQTFFNLRGVTITTVGMFGGMTYENPEIQKSIDQTFIAQQLKAVSLAKFEAQQKENERIELEADGLAEKARREASGLADAKRTAASAEAQSMREVSQALEEAKQNPLLYQFKVLELERSRVDRWDGKYPMYYLGTGMGNPNLLVDLPTPGGVASGKH